jgi:ectoine hydroxylase-related dioxygenase (phytanoyl-CoA dioxygenase family)
MEINLTPAERAQEAMSEAHLAQAVQAVRELGYVTLADVIDPDHLDVIRERMIADSQTLIDAGKWGGAGSIQGHLQQGPPPFAPYIFRDVVANPFAIQVTHTLLGDGLYNRFYNGNANTPGSGTQPLHADAPHLWPNTTTAHPASSLVVNVTLIEANEETGSTEIWPGTHLISLNGQHITADMEAQRRAEVPPVRANARKGSLVIRDMRMWHRGVPNYSNEIRHMIAMIHNIGWLQRPLKVLYNTGCEDAFPAGPLDHNAEFTDKPLEYLLTRTPTIKED